MVINDATALNGSDAGAAADAFTTLVESRLDDSYRVARLILRNPADAEDAIHDAFLAAWHRRTSLRDAAKLEAWFGRIVINACRDRLRHRRRHPADRLPAEPMLSTPAPQAGVADRLAMEAAFERLIADHRIVLVLRYTRDLTVEQVADLLGIPAGTVKSRVHHALKALRAALESPTARTVQAAKEDR